VATLLVVGYLLNTKTENSARILMSITIPSVGIFGYVLHSFLNNISLARRMIETFHEALGGNTLTAEIPEMTEYPPTKIIGLLILKVSDI
jgi:hypothetical protein